MSNTTADRHSLQVGLATIVASQLALGVYASALNEFFYAHSGPFYDSLAYTNTLARMASTAQTAGTLTALADTLRHSTVAYPWIMFAPFAAAVPLTRTIGTWIQVATAAAMQAALLFYFLRVRRTSLLEALVFSAVFALIGASFQYNGGIADFRMDLLQYLLFATTMALYLIARKSDGLRWWIVLGVSAGILCLARATTPVYLVPIFAVLAAADVISGQKRALLRYAVVAGVVAAVAGWFYAINFGYLYYYYVIWNQDAQANLPLATSVKHVALVFQHIGGALASVLVVIAAITLTLSIRGVGRSALRRLNWRPLIFFLVPTSYLVASGSGLNPFVSIVGVAGFIMFLLDPVDGERLSWPSTARRLACGALLVAGLANAALGFRNHTHDERVADWIPRQQGLRQITEVFAGAVARDGGKYQYAVVHSSSLNSDTIFNTLAFDHRLPSRGHAVQIGKAWLTVTPGFGVATDVEWNEFGPDDAARIANVLMRLERDVDFAIIPTADTKLASHVRMNAFVPEIARRALAAGQWIPLTGPIPVNAVERVIVLRNERRKPAVPTPP